MNTNEMTRKYIESLNSVGPHSFETDREQEWFKFGLKCGLEVADNDPTVPWISIDESLPCDHEGLVCPLTSGSIRFTQVVIVQAENGKVDLNGMFCKNGVWKWSLGGECKYWMPVSTLEAFIHK